MNVTIEKCGDELIAALAGEIDHHNSKQIREAIDAELEVLDVGRYWLDAANLHEYAGHTLLNLRASWTPAPAWRLSLRAINLADTAYADRADYAFGNYRYFPGRGRAAFVEVAYRHDR